MAARRESYFRYWLTLLLIGGGVSLIVGILTLTPPFQTLEYSMRDQLFKLRGQQQISDSPVVLVTISQKAYEEIPYDYPWPRSIYARLIENLNEAGAKAIGLDVVFDKRDKDNASADSAFARALEKYDNVVLAGRISRQTKRRSGGQSQEVSLVDPIPLFAQSNRHPFGIVSNTLDADDVIRRYLLHEDFMKRQYFAIGLEALRLYHGFSRDSVKVGADELEWGPYDIPLASRQSMFINYYGPADHFPSYSLEKVIDDSTFQTNFEREAFPVNEFNAPGVGLLQRGVFEDKIVLVGATIPELHDFHSTPLSRQGEAAMPGVEIHANALQTILDQNYLGAMPRAGAYLLIFAIALVLSWMARRLHPAWSGAGLVLFIMGYLVTGIWLFVEYNYILIFAGPLAAAVLSYGSTLGYDYVMERREKRRIRGMFQSYVSPALVEDMVESGKPPELGGEKKYITAFFSDIQSFSTISEQLGAERLVRLINDYLSAMTDIVQEQGGTLDKYIGDAIVAFYGAPVSLDDHAYRACITSQLMQRKLGELRQKWKNDAEEWPTIVYHMQNRIGINTGPMVTGNMGSSRRFNYTIMGDHVNLAARCESAAKSYGVYTMVTEYTKEEAERYGDRCVFRFLDKIVVKGKTEPVDVYEIYDLEDGMTQQDRQCIDNFEKGFEAYLNRRWKVAIDYFEKSEPLERNQPDDQAVATNPSRVMLDRCRKLRQNPPADDWDGVYVMTHK